MIKLPEHAPYTESERESLETLLSGLTGGQRYWLGAYFYVCGDASRMAGDVHEALLEIVEVEGGVSREDAETYVEEMRINGRYQRDVY